MSVIMVVHVILQTLMIGLLDASQLDQMETSFDNNAFIGELADVLGIRTASCTAITIG